LSFVEAIAAVPDLKKVSLALHFVSFVIS